MKKLGRILSATPQIILGLLSLAALALAAWVWWELASLPKEALVVWVILATLLLPVIAWAAWGLGRYETTATLKGLDAGLDRIVSVLPKVRTAKAEKPQSTVQVAVLPQLPPVVHRELPPGGGEVVDL